MFVLLSLYSSFNGLTQISPPGLGKAKDASWLAFGIRQEIGHHWQSMSYVGIGRKSNPDNFNLVQKQSIWILNQEFTYKFRKVWQTSVAISYRRQDEYESSFPYEHESPRQKQEFRIYGRFAYNYRFGNFKLVPTIRQEFRKYFTTNFSSPSENLQLRSRFRLQLIASLNKAKTQAITLSSEQLFGTSLLSTGNWTSFNYSESRFSIYYSYSFVNKPVILSIGYMNNLVGKKKPYDVHYLSVDVVWENPFGNVGKVRK